MRRSNLQNYRGFTLTEDTAKALHALEERANQLGKWKLDILGPKPGTDRGSVVSLAPAGREIHIKLRRSDRSEQESLNAAWACAVPLGFTPHDRWPRPSATDHIFYFLGPWSAINDRLLAEGRGHLAWPSVCIAAQCDVGVWDGDKGTERFIQSQLHRIGKNVGPIDGVIGPRTQAAIASLGLDRPSLAQVEVHLKAALPPQRPTYQPKQAARGHISIPGHKVRVQAFGGVRATQNGESGAALMADGNGRLVVEVEKT
jgi:hypothetical protein